jgi:hypothetical protein
MHSWHKQFTTICNIRHLGENLFFLHNKILYKFTINVKRRKIINILYLHYGLEMAKRIAKNELKFLANKNLSLIYNNKK